MKRIQNTSMIILVLAIFCFLLLRFFLPVSNWYIGLTGTLLIISAMTLVFSSVRLYKDKN